MNYYTFQQNNMFEEEERRPGIVDNSGLHYIMSFYGGIKTIEQVLSMTIVFALLICGQQPRTYFLFGVAALAFLLSMLFTVLHTFTHLERTFKPLYWIEFGICLANGLLFILASTATWTVYTQWYIIIAVIGFVAAVTYLIDTLVQFRLAQTPTTKYVWTTPHMST